MPKKFPDTALSPIFASLGAISIAVGAFGILRSFLHTLFSVYGTPLSFCGGAFYLFFGFYTLLKNSPRFRKALVKSIPEYARSIMFEKSIMDCVTPGNQPTQQSSWSGYAGLYIMVVMAGFLDREDVMLLTESLPKELEFLRRPGLLQFLPPLLQDLLGDDALTLSSAHEDPTLAPSNNHRLAAAEVPEETNDNPVNFFRLPRQLRDENALMSLEHDITTAAASIHIPDDPNANVEDFTGIPVAAAAAITTTMRCGSGSGLGSQQRSHMGTQYIGNRLTNVPAAAMSSAATTPLNTATTSAPSSSSRATTLAAPPNATPTRLSFEDAIQQVVTRHVNRTVDDFTSSIRSGLISTGRYIANGGDISDDWLASGFLASSGLALASTYSFSLASSSSVRGNGTAAALLHEPSAIEYATRSVRRYFIGLSITSGAILCSRHLHLLSAPGHGNKHNAPLWKWIWQWYQFTSQSLQLWFAEGMDILAAAPFVAALTLAALLTSIIAWRLRKSAREMRWLFNLMFERLSSSFGWVHDISTNAAGLIGATRRSTVTTIPSHFKAL